MRVLTLLMMFAVMVMSRRCPKYKCNDNANNTGTCAVWTDSGLEITPCKEGYICELSTSNDSTCQKINDIVKRYPGEYCENRTQCHSGECPENVCVGSKEGDPCQNHTQCDAELYCYDKKCKEPNGSCSLENKILCKSNQVCNKGKCIDQGSLGKGLEADTPIACQSWYLDKSKKCADAPSFEKEEATFCSYNIDGKDSYNDSKTCFKNDSGGSYCVKRGEMTMSSVSFPLHLVHELYEIWIQT